MRKRAQFLSLFSVITGAVGYLLRRWQLSTVFDKESGLAAPSALQTIVLIAFSVIVAVVILTQILPLRKYVSPDKYERALHSRTPLVFVFGILLCCLMFYGAFQCYKVGSLKGEAVTMGILAIFAAASGVSYMDLSVATARRKGGASLYLSSVILPVFVCFWLILSYKERAADPVLQDYMYFFLALGASAMALFNFAGYAYGKQQLRSSLFFAYMGIHLSVLCIADNNELYTTLFLAFLIATQLLNAYLLISNLALPEPPGLESEPEPDYTVDIELSDEEEL